jgi:DNA-binding MarR family transcriptional regulator
MQQMQKTSTTAAGDDPEALAAALMEIAALITREVRTIMRAHRDMALSVAHFRALGYVHRHPACSLTAVAEHLGLSVPATSRLVEALVADGLVVRELSAHDRRYVTLHLSAEGERIQDEARSAALRSLAARLEPLSPQQHAIIAQALDPLRQAFPSAAGAAAPDAVAAEESSQPGNAKRVLGSPAPPP